MTYTRRNKGTCSRQTTVVIEDGILKDIEIVGVATAISRVLLPFAKA